MDKSNQRIDEKLIEEYRSGDVLALQKLVERWHKRFCKKAFWLTKDADASKDIAQDSWTAIINKMDTLNDLGSFQSWALRIVFTKAIDWMRINERNKNKHENYYRSYDEIEEQNDNNQALKSEMLKAIKSLSIDQQIVLKLFYVEEYSLKEISELLKISVGTTKSRLFHAREKLKQQLKNIKL